MYRCGQSRVLIERNFIFICNLFILPFFFCRKNKNNKLFSLNIQSLFFNEIINMSFTEISFFSSCEIFKKLEK